MIDLQIFIDLSITALSASALIAGITPPSPTANKEERSRASKDFISKYGLASTTFVYGVQLLIVSFTFSQMFIIAKAYNQIEPVLQNSSSNFIQKILSYSRSSLPTTLTPGKKSIFMITKLWLLDPNVRSKYRIFSLLATLGGISRVICFRTLGHFFTFNLSIREGHKVIQSGPYAYVRHPAYTAIILLIVSTFYSVGVYGPLIPTEHRPLLRDLSTAATGILFVLIALRIRDEERMLQKELGKEYKEYMQKVRNRLIPFVF